MKQFFVDSFKLRGRLARLPFFALNLMWWTLGWLITTLLTQVFTSPDTSITLNLTAWPMNTDVVVITESGLGMFLGRLLTGTVLLAVIRYMLAIRRFHDLNWSGAWVILLMLVDSLVLLCRLLPLLWLLVLPIWLVVSIPLYWLPMDSDKQQRPNDYGAPMMYDQQSYQLLWIGCVFIWICIALSLMAGMQLF